jgi:hypothetical protein
VNRALRFTLLRLAMIGAASLVAALSACVGREEQRDAKSEPQGATVVGRENPGGVMQFLTWSRSGKLLAFSTFGDQAPSPCMEEVDGPCHDFFVVNRDGSGLRQVKEADLTGPAWEPPSCIVEVSISDETFCESPDGKRMIVGRTDPSRPSASNILPGGAFLGLWVTDAEGRHGIPLEGQPGVPEGTAVDGSWSPDGRHIAFMVWEGNDNFGPRSIVVIRTDRLSSPS